MTKFLHGDAGKPTSPRVQHQKRRKVLTTFHDLGAHPEIAKALADAGIETPFPIQEMAIPLALTGVDLIAQARTGTGKTLAFGVPLLQRIVAPSDRGFDDLDAPGKPQALVIAPTRELASQVSSDLALAGAQRGIRVLTVYGGMPYEPQLDALKAGVDVVVGTPGRLLDLANRRALALAHVKVLVLDEADRMLDLGFLPDVERLIGLTHELRQTMLFSATMPGDIVQLARRHMRHPMNVRAEATDESMVVPATAQFVYRAHDLDKPELVARILQAESRGRVMVFCTTKRAAARLADDLSERGFSSTAIHGDLSQALREKALERFRSGKVDVLVATDVAARGLDVEGVTHVVNYTCPDDEKTYLHRIGRTGRAGATGIAITFVDWPDTARWRVINSTLDLPFHDPVETYSTSEHFHHDLGIPMDVTGTLGPPKAPANQRSPRRGSDRGDRGDRGERSDRGERRGEGGSERRRRSTGPAGRSRRRLRGGVPVDGGTDPASTDSTSTSATASGSGSTGPADDSGADSGQSAPRRRRRRRRSGTPSDADSSATSEG